MQFSNGEDRSAEKVNEGLLLGRFSREGSFLSGRPIKTMSVGGRIIMCP